VVRLFPAERTGQEPGISAPAQLRVVFFFTLWLRHGRCQKVRAQTFLEKKTYKKPTGSKSITYGSGDARIDWIFPSVKRRRQLAELRIPTRYPSADTPDLLFAAKPLK
jgi:hypothetical protein